eukprot:TRINITY_DN5664_c0_g1_i3.p1 TRINITY_DN5664_c0_g1~~TRINITY_DN5664_c0_g1_i3.p1  ORF type:complete len:371 (-),score=34.37 TRINITY_DN5664_c0_g1_i3:2-1114(-)
MGGLFSKGGSNGFEKELVKIERQLTALETSRASANLNQRRIMTSILFYSIIIEVVLCVWFYFHKKPQTVLEQSLHASILVLFPLLVYGAKTAVALYYRRRIVSQDVKISKLRATLKTKLEERKRETEFDNTQNLLRKYGKLLDQDEPTREEVATPPRKQVNPATPQRPPPSANRPAPVTPAPTIASTPIPITPITPMTPTGFNPPQTIPFPASRSTPGPSPFRPPPPVSNPNPVTPGPRTWMDKLVDYIVGDGPRHGSVLVCSNCHQQNGFAPPGEEDMQFRCRFCGFLCQRGVAAIPPVQPAFALMRPSDPQAYPPTPVRDTEPSSPLESEIPEYNGTSDKPDQEESEPSQGAKPRRSGRLSSPGRRSK